MMFEPKVETIKFLLPSLSVFRVKFLMNIAPPDLTQKAVRTNQIIVSFSPKFLHRAFRYYWAKCKTVQIVPDLNHPNCGNCTRTKHDMARGAGAGYSTTVLLLTAETTTNFKLGFLSQMGD